MEDGNSDDWLPPGWRMEVKLRKFGRKDKIYCAPYGKKFYSKLEVLRHLKNDLPTDTPRLGEEKIGRVSSPRAITGNEEETNEVSLHHSLVDACDNGETCSPVSVEKGKTSLDVSTYFSCNSTVSSSLASEDGKINTGEAAITIAGESHANKLRGEQNGILHPSVETRCTKNLEEDSAPNEAPTFARNQSSVDETGNQSSVDETGSGERSSSIISHKRNSRHHNDARTEVIMEKCSAEGLPEGWTKEIKIQQKSGSIRMDLSTRMKKQKLAETCSSDNKEGVEDFPEKVVVEPPSYLMEELSVPECARNESKGCSSKLSETAKLEHSERGDGCSRKDFFSVIETKVISEESLHKKLLRGNEEAKACPPAVIQPEPTPQEVKNKDYGICSQNTPHVEDSPEESLPFPEESKDTSTKSDVRDKAARKPRKKKEINLPRRTSCRLAGISVDPSVEIPSRASRGNAKHVGLEGYSQVKPEVQSTEVLRVGVDTNCSASDKDTPDGKSGLSCVPTHNVDNESTEKKMAEKCGLPFELPSPEILQDPCIEFAIKTLTGMIDLNNLDHAFQPSNGMNSRSLDRSGKISETEKHGCLEQGAGAIMSPKKPTLSEEPTTKTIAEETAADMLSSSSLEGSWSDPCIEFAIKTLTGAIPVDYNVGVKDFFRQEMHTQQIRGSSNQLDLNSSVGADHFCRADVLRQHKQCQLGESNVLGSRRWLESAGKCEPAEVLHAPATSRQRGMPN